MYFKAKQWGGDLNVWNLSDDDSWVQNKHLDGCIFGYDNVPKPAYYALRKVIQGMKWAHRSARSIFMLAGLNAIFAGTFVKSGVGCH